MPSRLGRRLRERARPRPARRGCRRADDHRARPHPPAVLRGDRGLGGDPCRGRGGRIPVVANGDIRDLASARSALAASGRRGGDDRPRGAGGTLEACRGRGRAERRARAGGSQGRGTWRLHFKPLRGHVELLRARSRRPDRTEAPRLVCRRGRGRARLAWRGCSSPALPRRCWRSSPAPLAGRRKGVPHEPAFRRDALGLAPGSRHPPRRRGSCDRCEPGGRTLPQCLGPRAAGPARLRPPGGGRAAGGGLRPRPRQPVLTLHQRCGRGHRRTRAGDLQPPGRAGRRRAGPCAPAHLAARVRRTDRAADRA